MSNEDQSQQQPPGREASAMSALLSFVGDLSGNELMGWLFLGFGIASAIGIGIETPNLTHSILWCILAKSCWIHADLKER